MPDLVEQMYCSQQIFIPPNLPSILKKYAKAAIRTQPGDLLAWSSAYFRALAEGIPPPAKDRIEYPPIDTPSGLSPGFLKVLINQIGKRETVHKDVLADRWKGVCLNPKALQDLLDVGMFEDDVSWLEFLAICVGTLEPSLTRTMIELCELLTDEPEGGRASIPVTIFLNLYKYLAKLDCGPVNRLEQYEKTLIPDTETQCQATDLEPTEGNTEPEDVNIDWDTAMSVIESGVDDLDEGIVVEAAETENDENGKVSESVEQVEETAERDEQLAQLDEGTAENGDESSEQVEVTVENGDESAEQSSETVEKVVESPDQVEETVEISVESTEQVEEAAEIGDESARQVEKTAEKDDESTEQIGETPEIGDKFTGQVEETAEKGDESAEQIEETVAVSAEKAEETPDISDERAEQVEETLEKVAVSSEQSEETPNKSDEPAEQDEETAEKAEEPAEKIEKTEEEGVESAIQVEELVEKDAESTEQVEKAAEEADESAEQVEGTAEKGDESPEKVEDCSEEGDKPAELVEDPAEIGDEPAEQVEETAEKGAESVEQVEETTEQVEVAESAEQVGETTEQVEVANTESKSAELREAEPGENVSANEELTKTGAEVTETEIVSIEEGTKEGEVSDEIAKNGDGEVSNVEEQIVANEGQQGDSVKDDTNEDEKIEGAKNEDEADGGSKDEDQGEAEEDVLVNKKESPLEESEKTGEDQPTEPDAPADEAASPGDGKETDSAEANNDDVSQLAEAGNEPGFEEVQSGTDTQDAEDQAVDDAGKDVTDAPVDEGEGDKSVDDIVDGDNGEEPPAVDDTKDEKIVSTSPDIVQQESAEPSAEESVEVPITSENDGGKEQDDTESVEKAAIEETTAELPEKEIVTEDESGYESTQLQEDTKLSVEETIDPKSAYIINDDGTLSAPRAESVQEEDALKERDSDNSVITKGSDDGMMVWPDIKPQEKEEADPEPVLEKEVTSEDGIEVFTDIEMHPPTEELKILPEATEEEQAEVAETEENIFAPQIDSFTDLLEAESAPVEETNPEQLAAALQSTELAAEDIASVILALEGGESIGEEGASQGPPESGTLSLPDGKPEELDQKKERKPRKQKKDVEIDSLVKKDSDMMLLPTPITSDIMLYMDGVCDKTGAKLNPTQQLNPKMSMIDVQVSVPVDETVVEVFEHHRYPKWMHIPGIGPTVPDHIIEEAEKYFLKIAELQEGMVMPRNIKHFHCPPLELVPECPEGIAEGL